MDDKCNKELKELKQKLFGINARAAKNSKSFYLIIDPIAEGKGNGIIDNNLACFVNDCRKNIKMKTRTNSDINAQNTQFVSALVNGWPSIFLISIKDIQIGQNLLCYYGDLYHIVLQQTQEYQNDIKHRKQHLEKRYQNLNSTIVLD